MHSSKTTTILNLLLAFGLMFFSAPWWQTHGIAQGPADSKISSLLDIQVKEKNRRLGAGRTPRPANTASPQSAGSTLSTVQTQKLFLHFDRYPVPAQVSELESLGVTLYLSSWLPPTPNHRTGFMYAEAPVGAIPDLAGRSYVSAMQSAEVSAKPKNDQAALVMNVNTVWSSGLTGAGVTVAVLDSGLDLTQPDIPTPVAAMNYSAYPTVTATNIGNHVTGHGTHTTGSAAGRGTQSSGLYRGMAPGANLVFLKIGNDVDASASTAAMVNAIRDAVDAYHAKVITMSYGSFSTYHDGSSEVAQAVDYAVSKGAVYFGSAGNEALARLHYSGTVGGGGAYSDFIQVNVSGAGSGNTNLAFNLVWFDGIGTHNPLSLEYYSTNNAGSQILPTPTGTVSLSSQSESNRGTESQYSINTAPVPPGVSTWYLRVRNTSSSSQFYHIYVDIDRTGTGNVSFAAADPNYTIAAPAEADGAIAVGAYVTKSQWTSYTGTPSSIGQIMGQIFTLSSRGPRVDYPAGGTGSQKPDLVAPGSAIVSVRDTVIDPLNGNGSIVSNNGVNYGAPGFAGADYYVRHGTSMASPLAAGAAALLLGKAPGLTPTQVRNYLQTTATDKGDPGWDATYGWGLISAQAAVVAVNWTPPAASFTKALSPASGLAPCTVTFSDASSGPPTSWSWAFGDGTGSSSQNPGKTYSLPGNYAVTLTVTNPGGSSSASQTVSVYSSPSASFSKTLSPSNGVAPVTAGFTDASSGNITSWLWNFGDGTTSSTRNPSKVYSAGGNYIVSLTATNPIGSNTTSQTVGVYGPLTASFTRTLNPGNGAAPVVVTFTDTSVGNPTTWYWDFGDDTASISSSPSKTYTSIGNYPVTLTVTNPATPLGVTSAPLTIGVYASPSASFAAVANPPNAARPVTYSFTDTSTGNIVSWLWNFGDPDSGAANTSTAQNPSKMYTTTGSYTVTLTVTNPVGSSSASAVKQAYGLPTSRFSASAAMTSAGAPITFTDQSTGNPASWSWTFGDGTNSTAQNPVKSYAGAGIYTVGLMVTNPVGTSSTSDYITVLEYRAETAMAVGVDNSGYAYLAGAINRFYDFNTMATLPVADGIGSYSAYMSYVAGGVSMKAGSSVAPFTSPVPSLDAGGTMSSITGSQTGAAPVPPRDLFRLYPWINGSKDVSYTVLLRFNTITRAGGGLIPQGADVTRSFVRGDANNSGTVNITDALFIAQYLVGLRTLGETTATVNAVNAATPRNDSSSLGSTINITDALYIAQMLAGLRDATYIMI